MVQEMVYRDCFHMSALLCSPLDLASGTCRCDWEPPGINAVVLLLVPQELLYFPSQGPPH